MIMRKNRLFFYLIIFGILLFVYMLFGKFGNDRYPNYKSISKKEIVDLVKNDEPVLKQLIDSIEKEIDTAFYAEYRGKENRYQLYYLYNDTVGNFFSIDENIEKNVFAPAKSLEITDIWKFNSENFYRIQLIRNDQMTVQLLFLKSGQQEFFIKSGSDLSQYPIVKDESKLEEFSNSFLYQVDRNLLIRFKM